MKAYRLTKWLQTGEFQDIPVPEPGPGQALVRIGGAGACQSDLHLMHEWTPEAFPALAEWTLPFTLGHENAGWVEAGDMAGLEPGAPVVVSPAWSCGTCHACRVGATNYCDRIDLWDGEAGGVGLDGGMAEYMVVPSACLVPLRDLAPWQAAPLTDAGLTSYHAVKRCLPLLTPDVSVVVIGVGGLGHLAVEYLRELCGARIIAVDRDEGALELARELGADLCLPSDDQTASEIKKATQGLGAMAVLDFVGADATLAMAVQVIRKRGQIVGIGLGGGTLPVQVGAIPFGVTVVTTLGGSTPELAEAVALAEAGRIEPKIEKFQLDDVAEVYEKLRANEITGRAVLVP